MQLHQATKEQKEVSVKHQLTKYSPTTELKGPPTYNTAL